MVEGETEVKNLEGETGAIDRSSERSVGSATRTRSSAIHQHAVLWSGGDQRPCVHVWMHVWMHAPIDGHVLGIVYLLVDRFSAVWAYGLAMRGYAFSRSCAHARMCAL